MANPEFKTTIETPSPVSCMDVVNSVVVVGCEDGSVRRFDLPETKVQKALIGSGRSISWIRFSLARGEENCVWLATGMEILQYDFSSTSGNNPLSGSILRPSDAIARIPINPETEDDEINEIALKKDLLVFTTDSGRVGSMDLTTKAVKFCRQIHRNIALPIAFIPGRLFEICSGGYDSTLLHFDARTGSLLSHFDISPSTQDDETTGISLSPPFALGIAINLDDIIACGIATGHVWLGYGGSRKSSSTQGKRKCRKWNGLKATDGTWLKAGNGPIVAVAFHPVDETLLMTLSLHGNISCFEVPSTAAEPTNSQPKWTLSPRRMVKAATFMVGATDILACGVTSTNRGVLESWKLPDTQPVH